MKVHAGMEQFSCSSQAVYLLILCTIVHITKTSTNTIIFFLWLQRQFNIFVINLRDTYKGKVATFRQVIDIHRTELQSKESYWNEMLEVHYKYLKRFLSYVLNGMTKKIKYKWETLFNIMLWFEVGFFFQSLAERNRRLLKEKKVLLIQNKVEIERLEKEKVFYKYL